MNEDYIDLLGINIVKRETIKQKLKYELAQKEEKKEILNREIRKTKEKIINIDNIIEELQVRVLKETKNNR